MGKYSLGKIVSLDFILLRQLHHFGCIAPEATDFGFHQPFFGQMIKTSLVVVTHPARMDHLQIPGRSGQSEPFTQCLEYTIGYGMPCTGTTNAEGFFAADELRSFSARDKGSSHSF